MATVIIALVVIALAVVAIRAWRWSVALFEVVRGLEALVAGGKPRLARSAARGPVGRLVRIFNSAAAEIQAQIARLAQERQQLLVVFGAMAESVIAVDSRRRLLFANASADRLFAL